MIKKVNIALAIAFAAMFAMKGLKNIKEASAAKRAAAQAPAAEQQEESQLAPNIYYGPATRWRIRYQTGTVSFWTSYAPYSQRGRSAISTAT